MPGRMNKILSWRERIIFHSALDMIVTVQKSQFMSRKRAKREKPKGKWKYYREMRFWTMMPLVSALHSSSYSFFCSLLFVAVMTKSYSNIFHVKSLCGVSGSILLNESSISSRRNAFLWDAFNLIFLSFKPIIFCELFKLLIQLKKNFFNLKQLKILVHTKKSILKITSKLFQKLLKSSKIQKLLKTFSLKNCETLKHWLQASNTSLYKFAEAFWKFQIFQSFLKAQNL